MLQAEDRFQHARHASRRFQMADIGFNRAQSTALSCTAPSTQHQAQRFHLDRITQWRASTMRFDIADFIGTHPCRRQRLGDDTLLRQTIRRSQAIATTILIDRRTTNNCRNLITITQGIIQAL